LKVQAVASGMAAINQDLKSALHIIIMPLRSVWLVNLDITRGEMKNLVSYHSKTPIKKTSPVAQHMQKTLI
jgi:hypothetical protein